MAAAGVIGILVLVTSAWFAFSFPTTDFYYEYQIKHLTESSYSALNPGGGRLHGVRFSDEIRDKETEENVADLGRAQALILQLSDGITRQKLQGRLYLASRNWEAAAPLFSSLSTSDSEDPVLHNDLGVIYLALSEADPRYLLQALTEFRAAVRLAPTEIVEAHYNLVLVYRRLRLLSSAKEAQERYLELEHDAAWRSTLTASMPAAATDELVELTSALSENKLLRAQEVFGKSPKLFRDLAMSFATHKSPISADVALFIGKEISRRYGDETVLAMLQPLQTPERDKIATARQYVRRGAELYFQSNTKGSLDVFDQANTLLEYVNSPVDRYWLDLNLVDAQIRANQFKEARSTLEELISVARARNYRWFLAKALSIYGSTRALSSSFAEMMDYLWEAQRIFLEVGAVSDTARPLYYLAGYTHSARDHNEGLRLALQCLSLTPENDHIRLASLYWLLGSILYRKGMPDAAVLFESESLKQANETGNPIFVTSTASVLALLYETINEGKLAEHNLELARRSLDQFPSSTERVRAELVLNLLDGRIQLNRKRYPEAQELLERNLIIFQEDLPFTYLKSQSLMLLARVYAEIGRYDEARPRFNEAIELVENDDDYLASEKLRLAFDDERRELYDSAIAFEYDHGAHEAAWTYLQKYRAKLFLEFLAQFNPSVDLLRERALERPAVQRAAGKEIQIVEYALLKDRLLIWLTSDSRFESRSVSIDRATLENKVQQLLSKVRLREDIDGLSEELGRVLIEPVADLIDPKRTIAVIPDRALHGLPFGALRLPGQTSYLIQQYRIIVSPTLTHLMASDGKKPDRSALVSIGGQGDDYSGTEELSALREIYPAVEARHGANVDKPSFLAALNDAPVFHYAGHSATDAIDPLRSSILLDGNRYGPNSVTAVDIAHERLRNNAVVVLSSCDSSVGNSRDGVGMRGLTSAFLIGGAGSVVGSLWPVEASSTSDLMIRFHRAFATSGIPVAEALRHAQLKFLKTFPERAHPYYWSGFVVTGNFSALR